jgi:hypothetical protein
MSTKFAREDEKQVIRSCVSGCLVDIDLVGGNGRIVFPSLDALIGSIALVKLTISRWMVEADQGGLEMSYYVSQRCIGTEMLP